MASIHILNKDGTVATMAAIPIFKKDRTQATLAVVRDEGKHGQETGYFWDWLYILLISLPASLLGATLASDASYWLTAAPVCANASEWLLGIGLATGVVAAADGLIRYVRMGQLRPSKTSWIHVIGNLLALLLSASNLIYRLNEVPSRAVVPFGITLTATAVCVLIAVAYLGKELPPDLADHDGEDWDLL